MNILKERSRQTSKDSFFAKMEADVAGLEKQRLHGARASEDITAGAE